MTASILPALTVRDLAFSYGKIEALRSVSLEVAEGETVALVGANGAGKTTLLSCLAGLLPPARGRGQVLLFGRDVTYRPAHRRPADGVCLVPEGRQVFESQSVLDNLELGAFHRPRAARAEVRTDLETVLGLFPVLRERRRQLAGTLSGGEQQMLAIGRALMGRPRLLMLDEPSMGLAPLVVKQIFEALAALRAQGISILLVEQNARLALQLADSAYVMEAGRVVLHGPARALIDDVRVRQIYMGERARSPLADSTGPRTAGVE